MMSDTFPAASPMFAYGHLVHHAVIWSALVVALCTPFAVRGCLPDRWQEAPAPHAQSPCLVNPNTGSTAVAGVFECALELGFFRGYHLVFLSVDNDTPRWDGFIFMWCTISIMPMI